MPIDTSLRERILTMEELRSLAESNHSELTYRAPWDRGPWISNVPVRQQHALSRDELTSVNAQLRDRYMMTYEMRVLPLNGSFPIQSAYPTLVDAPTRTMLTRSAAIVAPVDLDGPRVALAREAEALLGYSALARDARAPGRLRLALDKLEIEVLEQVAVDKYKAQMVQHYDSHEKMVMPTWRLHPLRGYKQPVPEFVLSKAVQIKKELPDVDFYVDQLAVDPFLVASLVKLSDPNTNVKSRNFDPELTVYVEVWDEPKWDGA